MTVSNRVSCTIEYVKKETSASTPTQVSSHELTKTVASTSEKKNIKISSADSFMEKLLNGRIPNLIYVHGDQAHYQIETCPGRCKFAAVTKEKLIHFEVT